MTRHRRVSCSPTRRAAAATGISLTRVMTIASNRSVKPEPGRAHGTLTSRTPQSGQSMRATRACRKAWCWKKLRWRQVFLTGVVHRAVRLPAFGTGEAAAGLEIDLDIEPLLPGVEVRRRHHPRRHQPKRQLEQIDI